MNEEQSKRGSVQRHVGPFERQPALHWARLTVLAAGCYLQACASGAADAEDTGQVTEAVKVTAPPTPRVARGEASDEPAVTLRWDDASATRAGSALEATLTNNSDQSLTVEVTVLGGSPTEEGADVFLGAAELEPGQAQAISVSVDQLPLQSTGTWASVVLSASYERVLEGVAYRQRTSTRVRFVTSDTGWKRAIIRTGAEQTRVDSERARRGDDLHPVRMRRFDPRAGASRFADVDVREKPLVRTHVLPGDTPLEVPTFESATAAEEGDR